MTAARRGLAAKLALAAVSAGLALGVGELAARLLAPSPTIARPQQFTGLLADRHEIAFEQVFQPDPELFWRLAPGIRLPGDRRPLFGVISNRRGMREDHEIPRAKPPEEIRILFVGDSCTFGYLVAHERTFVEQTESILRERFPGVAIECVNAGVPGYSLFQGWRYLETEGFGYRPDLVVLNFGWNAPESWDAMGDAEHAARWRERRPPGPLAGSRLAGLLWTALRGGEEAHRPHRTHRPRLLPHEFRAVLESIGRSTGERGVDLLLLVGAGRSSALWTPTRDYRNPLQEIQYAFGADHLLAGEPGHLDTVPLVQELAAERPVGEILFDSVHPTPPTHRRIAEAIADRLDPWMRARTETGKPGS